jgi:hypothetical protein
VVSHEDAGLGEQPVSIVQFLELPPLEARHGQLSWAGHAGGRLAAPGEGNFEGVRGVGRWTAGDSMKSTMALAPPRCRFP